MKRLIQRDVSGKLNELLDGRLGEEEKRILDEYLSSHPAARRELAELRRLRELMGNRTALEPNIGFWTRLSAELKHRNAESGNLLPFPRKYIPLAAISGVLGILAIAVFTFQNKDRLADYLRTQTQSVQQAVNEGVMKGSLLPLFANVDRDQALEFGLLGTLPLDAKSETSLRIDERSKKGYRIEVRKNPIARADRLTMEKFLADIRPTAKQRAVIDTLLELASSRIERSVLLGENEAVAIDPTLPQLNKVIVSGIAACLEPDQQQRLEHLLEVRDAPYSFRSHRSKVVATEEVVRNVAELPGPHHFVVVTPETLLLRQVLVDFPRMQEELARSLNMRAEIATRRSRMIARFTSEPAVLPHPQIPLENVQRVRGVMRVEIERMAPQGVSEGFNVMLTPRTRRNTATVTSSDEGGLEFHFVEDSAKGGVVSSAGPRIRFYGRTPGGVRIEISDAEEGKRVYQLQPRSESRPK